MRYLSTISLALIVLMALACTATPVAPTAVPPPAYSDADFGAVKGFLHGAGMESRCGNYARVVNGETAQVRRDTSNPDKYYVTVPRHPHFSWTFIGSLGKVISTSTGQAGYYGC
jgi:hypothetical protein